jgi:hypothetical protein
MKILPIRVGSSNGSKLHSRWQVNLDVLKYSGGCQSIFYFNVYKNTLNPTVTTNDIICTTKQPVGGSI